VVLPVLVAALEQHLADCDGREFLTALALGLDAAMRIGRAGGPKGTRGWNYSVLCASMGAVLAVARLRRWDVDTTVNALGLQLSQLAGGLQAVIDKSMAVRFLPAFMAQDVLTSTALAQAGVDGPRQVFGGRAGFIALYQEGSFDQAAIEPGLAQCALVDELSLKPYPSCRFTHAGVDLALQLHARGLRPGDIAHLRILVTKQTLNMVGRPFDGEVASVTEAQFSMAYGVALAIARGALRIADFTPPAVRDPHLAAFAATIRVERNESVPTVGMLPVRFELRLANGESLALEASEVSGSAGKRMTPAQFQGKVADCLAHGGSRVGAAELMRAAGALRSGAPVSALLQLLS
jgi:2-methylcitrate dehydratase PrpD